MNAKNEFLKHIGNRKVLCATISDAKLGTAWDKEEWFEFLKLIDVEYDNGYGHRIYTEPFGMKMELGVIEENMMVVNGGIIIYVQRYQMN